MADLTQEQKDFFDREEAKLLADFRDPQYVDYTIKYVTDPQQADVKISKNHIIFDYLAIGIACLAKEIKNPDGEKVIYAIHQEYPSIEQVVLHDELYPPQFGGRSLAPNALSDLLTEPDIILQKYFNNKAYLTAFSGFLMYSTVTTTVMGYTENPELTLDFENFNDTIAAQELAFETLKKLTISNCLGALYACLYGDD